MNIIIFILFILVFGVGYVIGTICTIIMQIKHEESKNPLEKVI